MNELRISWIKIKSIFHLYRLRKELLKIKLSRHAKRRAKLYKIPESIILSVLHDEFLLPGKNEIVKNVKDLQFPLKIVYLMEEDELTVITNYPVKKERKS